MPVEGGREVGMASSKFGEFALEFVHGRADAFQVLVHHAIDLRADGLEFLTRSAGLVEEEDIEGATDHDEQNQDQYDQLAQRVIRGRRRFTVGLGWEIVFQIVHSACGLFSWGGGGGRDIPLIADGIEDRIHLGMRLAVFGNIADQSLKGVLAELDVGDLGLEPADRA